MPALSPKTVKSLCTCPVTPMIYGCMLSGTLWVSKNALISLTASTPFRPGIEKSEKMSLKLMPWLYEFLTRSSISWPLIQMSSRLSMSNPDFFRMAFIEAMQNSSSSATSTLSFLNNCSCVSFWQKSF